MKFLEEIAKRKFVMLTFILIVVSSTMQSKFKMTHRKSFLASMNSFQSKLTSHFKAMSMVNLQKKNMLTNLISLATSGTSDSLFKRVTTQAKTQAQTQTQTRTRYKAQTKAKITNPNLLTEDGFKGSDFPEYEYKDYKQIVAQLKEYAAKYPQYMKLTTAQKEFGLPNPGGDCGNEKMASADPGTAGGILNRKKRTNEDDIDPDKTKCYHYIVYLSNTKYDTKLKPNIYISGSVHGDERVGPTATLELIGTFLNNLDDPWLQYLLDTRQIVITPMTNPHGYYVNEREELLIAEKDKSKVIMTSNNYEKTHKDINRDFPYLVDKELCMETIGARVVNELFLKYKFVLSLSLHGGTESLTYPYGTPNHMNKAPHFDIKYEVDPKTKKVKANSTQSDEQLAASYKKGQNDNLEVGAALANSNKVPSVAVEKGVSGEEKKSTKTGAIESKSNPPPDYNSIQELALSTNEYSTTVKARQYATGDMNTAVYPVRGGMEDWAYSASWEGSPIITQPCTPASYNGYEQEKTMYEKKYPDAIRNIMLLLEVSNVKFPQRRRLGKSNKRCLLNLNKNATFNDVLKPNERKLCLDKSIDGYIPRIIRISLSMIDLLIPYVNFKTHKANGSVNIEWIIGGSIQVDNTYVLYKYIDESESKELSSEELLKAKSIDELKKKFPESTKPQNGSGVWNVKILNDSNAAVTLPTIEETEEVFEDDEEHPLGRPKKLHRLNVSRNENFIFKEEIKETPGKKLVFVIVAVVDQSMGNSKGGDPKDVPPQTHFANLRTNENYVVGSENEALYLEGRSFFISKIGTENGVESKKENETTPKKKEKAKKTRTVSKKSKAKN